MWDLIKSCFEVNINNLNNLFTGKSFSLNIQTCKFLEKLIKKVKTESFLRFTRFWKLLEKLSESSEAEILKLKWKKKKTWYLYIPSVNIDFLIRII